MALALEHAKRIAEHRRAKFTRRPVVGAESVLVAGREADRGRLLVWSTLTAKWLAGGQRRALVACLHVDQQQRRVERHRGEAVGGDPERPASGSKQVTTVTPVAKQPSASRSVRGSDPVRYSLVVSCGIERAIQSAPAHQSPAGPRRGCRGPATVASSESDTGRAAGTRRCDRRCGPPGGPEKDSRSTLSSRG